MKCILVFAGISLAAGFIGGTVFLIKDNGKLAVIMMASGWGVAVICLVLLFFVLPRFISEKGEPNKKDYKIKCYDCALEEDIESRVNTVYGQVTYSKSNPKNFYSSYHKPHEVIVVAVMHVTTAFNEDEYLNFMNEIPELTEHVINHTLIAIFIEEEKSPYLKEIMYTPEYNSLWDTKIFSVYDQKAKRLKVNKTNSGTGNKPYNDARKELDRIFTFIKDE